MTRAEITKAVLYGIASAISGLHSLRDSDSTDFARSGAVVSYCLDALYELKNEIAEEYQTNDELERFDAVFAKAGMDLVGIRWTVVDDTEEPFVVKFADDSKEQWAPW